MAAGDAGRRGAGHAHFSDGDRQGSDPLGDCLCGRFGRCVAAGRSDSPLDNGD